ncbi:hypothetical protein BHE18_15350 [Rossellomorea aquimaris]|uniref:Uncharacterized protein n=1 Tax=Rossellomorea aquimaris TaxID=189382 RepID=A0A1J6W644_9BACI|nr:hypothetical protein BHE18_15350 [Rossellomorea aquimaris]
MILKRSYNSNMDHIFSEWIIKMENGSYNFSLDHKSLEWIINDCGRSCLNHCRPGIDWNLDYSIKVERNSIKNESF